MRPSRVAWSGRPSGRMGHGWAGDPGTLIAQLINSLGHVRAMSDGEMARYTWSAQFVPLIWCTIEEPDYRSLERALTEQGCGLEAQRSLQRWWRTLRITTKEEGFQALCAMAEEVCPRNGPTAVMGYLHAALQEHVMCSSGADMLVVQDLRMPGGRGPPGGTAGGHGAPRRPHGRSARSHGGGGQ